MDGAVVFQEDDWKTKTEKEDRRETEGMMGGEEDA